MGWRFPALASSPTALGSDSKKVPGLADSGRVDQCQLVPTRLGVEQGERLFFLSDTPYDGRRSSDV
jgi:hypothetical protein